MRVKASRRRRKQVNLYRRRWNIFAKESTAHDRRSRPSRSDYLRRDKRALSCHRQNGGRPGQKNRLRATFGRGNRGANRRPHVRERLEERSSANHVAPLRIELYGVRRVPLRGDVPTRVVPAPPKKPRAPARKSASRHRPYLGTRLRIHSRTDIALSLQ